MLEGVKEEKAQAVGVVELDRRFEKLEDGRGWDMSQELVKLLVTYLSAYALYSLAF